MEYDELKRAYDLLQQKYIRHEKILIQSYKSLKQKEIDLKKLNDELCTSEEELQATNEELSAINDELFEKSNVINVQNKKLRLTLKELRNTQTNLFQAEKMASLGILTAGVAHEINNPLNYIMGSYVGLMDYFEEQGVGGEPIVSCLLDGLKLGIERATNIVKGLNQFSRDSKSNDEECDLHAIIDNCLAMLQNQIKHKVELILDYQSDIFVIKGNVGKMHQVFMNIINNSIQAIEKEGTLTIKTHVLNNAVHIEIADTGSGIPQEELPRITDPFFTTKDPGKGTGLGLSITYHIIKEHGGSLIFSSELGKGTTAKIILPNKG